MKNRLLIKTDEAAKILACSKRKLEADRIRGCGIAFIKIGRSVRYDLQDLENYISNNRFSSTGNHNSTAMSSNIAGRK